MYCQWSSCQNSGLNLVLQLVAPRICMTAVYYSIILRTMCELNKRTQLNCQKISISLCALKVTHHFSFLSDLKFHSSYLLL